METLYKGYFNQICRLEQKKALTPKHAWFGLFKASSLSPRPETSLNRLVNLQHLGKANKDVIRPHEASGATYHP